MRLKAIIQNAAFYFLLALIVPT